jgi:hypothetical protein
LEEPKLNSPKFDWLCNVIVSGNQRLTQNRIKGCGHEKEDNLASLNNVEIARNSVDIVPVVGV